MTYIEILQAQIKQGEKSVEEAMDWLVDNTGVTNRQAIGLLFPIPEPHRFGTRIKLTGEIGGR